MNSLNACIVRFTVDNKVLLVKHRLREWEFPGGKIDTDKDRLGNTDTIDLLKTATREFREEVSEYIGCVGSPERILFEPNYRTVFFVYINQDCAFDCFEKYADYIGNDPAIEKVEHHTIDSINDIVFSFDNDKHLIKELLNSM